jgi:hypothetical protein
MSAVASQPTVPGCKPSVPKVNLLMSPKPCKNSHTPIDVTSPTTAAAAHSVPCTRHGISDGGSTHPIRFGLPPRQQHPGKHVSLGDCPWSTLLAYLLCCAVLRVIRGTTAQDGGLVLHGEMMPTGRGFYLTLKALVAGVALVSPSPVRAGSSSPDRSGDEQSWSEARRRRDGQLGRFGLRCRRVAGPR